MALPSGLAGLVSFVLFVAPGFAYECVFSLRRPGRDVSTFQELAAVVAVSAMTSGAAIVALLILLSPPLYETLHATALNPAEASREALLLFVAAVASEVATAVLLAVALAVGLTWKVKGKIYNEPVWFLLFQRHSPHVDSPRYAVIRLASGDRYYGEVVAYTTAQVPQNERDLVLGPPLWVRWAGTKDAEEVTGFGRIAVNADAIESVSVSYLPPRPSSTVASSVGWLANVWTTRRTL